MATYGVIPTVPHSGKSETVAEGVGGAQGIFRAEKWFCRYHNGGHRTRVRLSKPIGCPTAKGTLT